ncbi:uncharacterized protein LOC134851746 isoform X2 [Symsagittifera roscoffensis]|uniref:uncharacterized protein LOC134851746 isoform X2 n=1 Tax=Symsagittifera roscoffensis TaxID=84072 RepID=UPI00307B73E0
MIHFVQKMALNGKFLTSKSEEVELIRLGSTLAEVDSQLSETVAKVARLTGRVEVMLSWQGGSDTQDFSPRTKNRKPSCLPVLGEAKTEQRMEVTGYKVFLNGRQYGLTVNSDVKNMVLRMNVEKQLHKISLMALSAFSSDGGGGTQSQKHRHTPSSPSQPGDHSRSSPSRSVKQERSGSAEGERGAESNIVLVPTDTFKPLSLFCFMKAHSKNTRWPQTGCCVLTDSLPYERHQLPVQMGGLGGGHYRGADGTAHSWSGGAATSGRLISPGCLRKVTPCPSVDVFNILTRHWQPLFPINSTTSNNPTTPTPTQTYTVLLFWTSWCASSHRLLKFLLGHGRDNPHLNFITCCVGSGESSHEHYTDVYETLATYPDSFMDNVIHTCGCMRVGGGLQQGHGQGGVGNSNINQQEQNRPLKRRPQSSRSSLRGSRLHQNNAYYSSPAELFGVQGVPMMFIITGSGLIAWQARFAAYSQSHLDEFLKEAMIELDKNEASLTVGRVPNTTLYSSAENHKHSILNLSNAPHHIPSPYYPSKRENSDFALGSEDSLLIA